MYNLTKTDTESEGSVKRMSKTDAEEPTSETEPQTYDNSGTVDKPQLNSLTSGDANHQHSSRTGPPEVGKGYTSKFSSLDTEYYGKKTADETQKTGAGLTEQESLEAAEKMEEASRRSQPPTQLTAGGKTGKTGRKVFVMRHAERMDRIFPGWTRLGFTDHQKYRPYDLNQPLSLPKRCGGINDYHDDSPITEMGYVTAQMVGRGMRLSKVHFNAIYTSPALRCIQTGHGLLKTLNLSLKMRVEPGLFEWLAWYDRVPSWLSVGDLTEACYQVDSEYKPVMSVGEVKKRKTESAIEYYKRVEQVTNAILNKHQRPGSILIIGHGPTVDAASRSLLGKKVVELPRETMDKMGLYFPYCCVVGVEEKMNGNWSLIHNAIPPISYLDATNRIDHKFFNRD